MKDESKELIRVAFKEPYPRNLFMTLAADKWYDIHIDADNITEDMAEGLTYALSTLPPRDQEVIRMRYAEKMTFTAIGKHFEVTGERIRTVEHRALVKLRHPPLLGYVKYGKEAYEKRCAELEAVRERNYADAKYQTEISTWDIPVRAQNRLIAKGYRIVKDIIDLTEDEIIGIQYLGRKSIIDVAKGLEALGITDTNWNDFLK